jgi:hypothetical protein
VLSTTNTQTALTNPNRRCHLLGSANCAHLSVAHSQQQQGTILAIRVANTPAVMQHTRKVLRCSCFVLVLGHIHAVQHCHCHLGKAYKVAYVCSVKEALQNHVHALKHPPSQDSAVGHDEQLNAFPTWDGRLVVFNLCNNSSRTSAG